MTNRKILILATALGATLLMVAAGGAAEPKGNVPPELAGTWSWTTISGTGYVNTTTGQLAEPSGMSARFTFTSDGRYKSFFYARQRNYNLLTESTTTHEGTVTFADDGTFTMRPSKGHYKWFNGARPNERDMTAEERKVQTYRWTWRDDGETRQLFIGPSEDALSPFKKE